MNPSPQTPRFSFNAFVSGDGLLNFCLSVGVFLLIVTYGGIMHRINPNPVAFGYDVTVSVVEAFFFGLATFLVIRQAQKHWVKLLYAGFEGVALFLYYNSPYFGAWANFALTTYISVFAAFTFYSLGYISLHRYREQLRELAREARRQALHESQVILDKTGAPFKSVVEKPAIGFQAQAKPSPMAAAGVDANAGRDAEVLRLLAEGYTYREVERRTGVTLGTISRIKNRHKA